MVNEAILVFETGPAIPFTVANGTGIEKGSICMLADLMTAATATGDEDYVAGIAATEKIASDGNIRLGLFREGIFKVMSSGSIAAGVSVATHVATGAAANLVIASDSTCLSSKTLGIAMEAAEDGETFLMELKPGCMANGV